VDEARRKTGNGDACSVLLTTTGARYFVRQVLESYLPGITVLSHAELPSEVKILVVGRENAGSLVASGVGVQ
jgi:flagellar biosynthesis component FlhA